MSKAEFFHQLRERLRGLPYEEQQNILSVYEDLFHKAEANGKNEREIIESLGYRHLEQAPVPTQPVGNGNRIRNTAEIGLRTILAGLALGLFNLIIVLLPFLLALMVLFLLGLTAVLLTFSSIWIIVGTGVPESLTTLLLMIFAGMAATGLGVLMSIGLWYVFKVFWKLVRSYVRINLRLIKGE